MKFPSIFPSKNNPVLFILLILIFNNYGNIAGNTVITTKRPTKSGIIKVGRGSSYKLPSQAATIAKDGDIVEIDADVYIGDVAIWRQNNLVIRCVGGRAHLKANGAYAEGKGIWVIKGNNTMIENIEFSGATVPDHNGAGIRQEGAGLKIKGCYFHDNEMGILAGNNIKSKIVIEKSEFANNGFGDGYTHNIYINHVKSFTVRNCYFHHAKIGHNIKSRTQKNYILYNRIMDENLGTSSYIIDLPNGGISYIIGNLIQQGPNTCNSTIVSYGAEGLSNPDNNLYIVNNTFVNNFHSGTFVRVAQDTKKAKLINNIFIGPGNILRGPGKLITNLILVDPALKNAEIFDYHLTRQSPAIDAGSNPGFANGFNLTPVLQYVHPLNCRGREIDGKIDIGAYEFIKY